MHMLFKAAAAVAVIANPAAAERYTFTLTKERPIRFSLLSDGSQSNRIFSFDAQLFSEFTSSLSVTLLTNYKYCAEIIYCRERYPDGVLTETATFATAPTASYGAYSLSLLGNAPGEAQDVFITFSTLSNQVIEVRDLRVRFGNLVAEAPEPSTWALMLAGFAMTGYALRRRKVAFA